MFCWDVNAAAASVTPKVGTVCAASKRGGQKDGNEYCSLEIGSSAEAVEEILWAPTLFLRGEGRCSVGRNDRGHHRSHRGMGSGICRKFLRDNVGKVRVAAGLTTTRKDLVPSPRRRSERSADWRMRS